MIKLGKIQEVEIKRIVEHGAYVGVENDDNDVFLPMKQIPKGADVEDIIEVFVYRDSEDRLIATTMEPYAEIDTVGYMEVVDNSPIGAFVDWGLVKDLLVPFKQQHYKLQKGKSYLIGVYEDKTGRLCGTTAVYEYLSDDSHYEAGDYVNGVVYRVKPELGALVAVDNKYRALIPESELYTKLYPGDEVIARVIRKREDGKLDISLRREVALQISSDAKNIYDKLKEADGYLPYHDKSSADDIKSVFKMSKNAFKRAIGSLYKERLINIEKSGIRLIGDE